MKQEENNFRGLLKDKMADYQPDPPGDIWGRVQDQLDGSSRRRRLFYFLPVAAGIAIVMGIGFTLFFNSTGNNASLSQSEQNTVSPGQQADSEILSDGTLENNPESLSGNQEKRRSPGENGMNRKQQEEMAAKAEERIDDGSQGPLERKVVRELSEVIGLKQKSGDDRLAGLTDRESGQNRDVGGIVDSDLKEVSGSQTGTAEMPENVFSDSQVVVNEDSLLNILHDGEPVVGEEQKQKTDRSSRWQVGASVAPLYSYRDAEANDVYRNTVANISESAKITYSGGVNLGYKQSDRLSFEGGIYYSSMGVNIGKPARNSLFGFGESDLLESSNAANKLAVANSMGTIVDHTGVPALSNYGSDLEFERVNTGAAQAWLADLDAGIVQTMGFLEVPLKVKYLVLDQAVKIEVAGGISTNILVGSSAVYSSEDRRVDLGEINDLQTFNYSGNAGIGLIYALTGNMNILLEPSFRYYLNSINSSELPSTRPYAFGLFTGMNYSF